VPVINTVIDSVKVVDVRRDSIHVLDSVLIYGKNDTVYSTRWRVEYREALRVDTFYSFHCDTVNTIVEVERKLSRIEELKMDIGNGVMWAVPILLALWLLYRKIIK
jgi:hypothetical protein